MNSILLVGGTWDFQGGKKSRVVEKFAREFSYVTVYNGGYYFDLHRIIETSIYFDVVLWWANVPNDMPKVRNVKEINYKALLVTSKRNNGEYTFEELLQRSLEAKANLTIEFSEKGKVFNMRLFDPLGNLWYDGASIISCAEKMQKRLEFLSTMTREPTISSDIKLEDLNLSDDTFNEDFLGIVRNYANVFAEAIFQTKDVKRFLGNASFRCPKGFPSFRQGDLIFVSRRNVNKEFISAQDFVPVYMKDRKIYYIGENKPSVDTPIQVRLYKMFPNINFMIHSHCYIKNAMFTDRIVPCGAIEEVDEIERAVKKFYNGNFERVAYVLNLRGHGSIMMSKDPELLKDINIVGRQLPEIPKQKNNR